MKLLETKLNLIEKFFKKTKLFIASVILDMCLHYLYNFALFCKNVILLTLNSARERLLHVQASGRAGGDAGTSNDGTIISLSASFHKWRQETVHLNSSETF